MIGLGPLARQRRLISAALVVVALVALMSFTSRERERITRIEELLIEMVAPVQSVVTGIASRITGFIDAVGQWREMHEELVELRAEIERYHALEHAFAETFAENMRLARLLELSDRAPVSVTAARVIGRNPDNWFNTLVIDRGYRHGVMRNMTVMSGQGVVGRVIRVTARTATVLLITDPDSGIGAMVQRSRDPGVVVGKVGDSNTVTMNFFDRNADVETGDVIITSGVGSLFPKGLIIGRVESVDSYSQLMTTVQVRPDTDLRRLEEVVVLLGPGLFNLESEDEAVLGDDHGGSLP